MCFHVLWGLSVDIIIVILYKYSVPISLNLPITENFLNFYIFKKNKNQKNIACFIHFISYFPHGDQKNVKKGQ